MPILSGREPLSPDLVERGTITKQLLFQSSEVKVTFLNLGIDAKIRKHSHPESRVTYYKATTAEVLDEVEADKSHSFANSTGGQLPIIVIEEFVN